MKRQNGRFVKGERYSPTTEFKPGQHWRPPADFRKKEWLELEYVEKKRSSEDIARQFSVTPGAILFWLKKHGIARRNTKEVRKNKKWATATGENNPMFGRTGDKNPRWLGGVTPERQALYSSEEWAKAVSDVYKRDNATCQKCFVKGKKLHVHHIVSFANKALRAEVSNLVLLCVDCHRWVHSRKNTKKDFIK